MSVTLAARAAVQVEIRGVDDEMRDSVIAGLGLAEYRDREISEARARYLYSRAEREIAQALEPFGYYTPQIDGAIERTADGVLKVAFVIDPGAAVEFARVWLEVPPPAPGLDPITLAVDAFDLERGDRLDHELYEIGKKRVAPHCSDQLSVESSWLHLVYLASPQNVAENL